MAKERGRRVGRGRGRNHESREMNTDQKENQENGAPSPPSPLGFDMAQFVQLITATVQQVLAQREANNSASPPPGRNNHAEEIRRLQQEVKRLGKAREAPPLPPLR